MVKGWLPIYPLQKPGSNPQTNLNHQLRMVGFCQSSAPLHHVPRFVRSSAVCLIHDDPCLFDLAFGNASNQNSDSAVGFVVVWMLSQIRPLAFCSVSALDACQELRTLTKEHPPYPDPRNLCASCLANLRGVLCARPGKATFLDPSSSLPQISHAASGCASAAAHPAALEDLQGCGSRP